MAITMLDAGDDRKRVVERLKEEFELHSTQAYKYVRDAIVERFDRDSDLGGMDVQFIRQRLTERAWERSTTMHNKAMSCFSIKGDELDEQERRPNLAERGIRFAKGALDAESKIAIWYHVDKIAPDYDLSSEETRELVARAVGTHADAFGTTELIQLGNAIARALSTRPVLEDEKRVEAKTSERLRRMVEQARDEPSN